ncbi:hypothetical protein B0H14DRAFT_2641195 [Mycena olivaceomarginata]|nr:hypothetical protein B0H14DRAFT_2641195 [Mycena olivaceomarginata]
MGTHFAVTHPPTFWERQTATSSACAAYQIYIFLCDTDLATRSPVYALFHPHAPRVRSPPPAAALPHLSGNTPLSRYPNPTSHLPYPTSPTTIIANRSLSPSLSPLAGYSLLAVHSTGIPLLSIPFLVLFGPPRLVNERVRCTRNATDSDDESDQHTFLLNLHRLPGELVERVLDFHPTNDNGSVTCFFPVDQSVLELDSQVKTVESHSTQWFSTPSLGVHKPDRCSILK